MRMMGLSARPPSKMVHTTISVLPTITDDAPVVSDVGLQKCAEGVQKEKDLSTQHQGN